MNWFKGLSTIWKIVLIAGVLILAVIIFDKTTGGISDLRSWMFDRNSAAREEKIDKITAENDKLRQEKNDLVSKALELEAKYALLEAKDKNIDDRTKAEQDKLAQDLANQTKEEETTSEPTSAYIRCQRMKAKMFDLKIPSAGNINCEQYQKPGE